MTAGAGRGSAAAGRPASDPDRQTKPGPSAWDTALRLLGVRARSRTEMRQRLQRKDFDVHAVDDVMDRLDRARLLDDAEFAAEWVHSRHTYSGKGRIALRHELKAKGVADDLIEAALAEVAPDDERAVAVGLVHRKLTPSVTAAVTEDRAARDKQSRRLTAMLVRRGFAQPLAIEVVSDALDAAVLDAAELD